MLSRLLVGVILTLSAVLATASNEFLPPDQAFKLQATSTSNNRVTLKWDIAPRYYLYHDQFKVSLDGANLALKLPKGQQKDDPTFGKTTVHYNQVLTTINVEPNSQYTLNWQGCAEDGLCYPPQRKTIQTDAEGLLPQQNLTQTKTSSTLLGTTTTKSIAEPDAPSDINIKSDTVAKEDTKIEISNLPNESFQQEKLITQQEMLNEAPIQIASPTILEQAASEQTLIAQPSEQTTLQTSLKTASLSNDWNNDQFFLNLLSNQNMFLNIIVFLGLGILLAFLPCSLPLIPILSGILVQRNKGYKAAVIATTFIVSMALVYGLMGVIVSQIGYNVQRWFQSPVFISAFAVMFVVFALSLFGLFQLSLPQSVLQRLDRIQQRQKGGSLIGAAVMGVISALIVGPCMSAPLAGALLYVSQLEQTVLAGLYLFLLGLGIGIPLFIASVFGAKFLPQPGLWMDRLKFSFGFVMLILAVYFARPLLPISLYYVIFGLTLIIMAAYLLSILLHVIRTAFKLPIIVLSCILAASGVWHITQAITSINQQSSTELHTWIIVKNKDELNAALQANRFKPMIIDVYADWCVACQPIERNILPLTEVQDALKQVTRIKLDLTTYEASQDEILKQWQILGPPTMLFIQADATQNSINESSANETIHLEQRNLRLTGTYNAAQLIGNIQKIREKQGL